MLWLAGKLKSEFLRQPAYLLYAIVLLRFGFVDLPDQYLSPQGSLHSSRWRTMRSTCWSGWWCSEFRSRRWRGRVSCSRSRARPRAWRWTG